MSSLILFQLPMNIINFEKCKLTLFCQISPELIVKLNFWAGETPISHGVKHESQTQGLNPEISFSTTRVICNKAQLLE